MLIKPADIVKITLAPFLIYVMNDILFYIFPDLSLAWHVDIYLHLAGGMAIAGASIAVLNVLERADLLKIKSAVVAFFIVVALAMAAAVLWEFYEFIHDQLYGSHFQPSLFDTMKDLFMGTTGGVVWYLLHFIKKRSAL